MVYRLAYVYLGSRRDAENAAQETFARFFRAGVSLDDEFAVKSCLVSLVTGICLSRIDDPAYVPAEDSAPHEIDEVMAAVMELPGKYKTVAYLFYNDGHTAREISGMLDTDMNIVSTIIAGTRRMLRAKLGGDFDD